MIFRIRQNVVSFFCKRIPRNTKEKNKKRCKYNVLERNAKECERIMEPVGVYKILLNQWVYRFITPFVALFKIFHYLLSFQSKQKNRQRLPAVKV